APVAVAAAGHWLAVAQRDGVRVWWREGEHLVAVLPFRAPLLVALTPDGGAYVARETGTELRRYRPGGAPRGVLRTGLPGRVEGLRVDRNRLLWLLTEDGTGMHIWRAGPGGADWEAATLAVLSAALPRSALAATREGG